MQSLAIKFNTEIYLDLPDLPFTICADEVERNLQNILEEALLKDSSGKLEVHSLTIDRRNNNGN